MDVRPIRTEADYETALADLEPLLDAAPGTPEHDKLAVLSVLVEAYETEHYPIPLPDPIAAIEFHMERLGLTRKDLEPCLGSRARVSEILNRRRPLTLRMIRNLEKTLDIPAAILVQEYELTPVSQAEDSEDAPAAEQRVRRPLLTAHSAPVLTYTPSETEDESMLIPAPAWMIPANFYQVTQNTSA